MGYHSNNSKLFGVMARFGSSDELVDAANKAREAGYKKMDAYSPIPVHGLYEALGFRRSILPWLVLTGGILGGIGGFYLQYWVSVDTYPLNVGGRPFFSWPSFIPVIFECTILGASLTAVFSMCGLNGLPMPYHPVFNADGFELASKDKFFICIESEDEQFDEEKVTAFLQKQHPESVGPVNY